ncbi:hypothetical protein KCV07_g67, partial [Aureobasidium melanogenum]
MGLFSFGASGPILSHNNSSYNYFIQLVDKGSAVTVVGSNKMHRTIAARNKDQKAIGNARQESACLVLAYLCALQSIQSRTRQTSLCEHEMSKIYGNAGGIEGAHGKTRSQHAGTGSNGRVTIASKAK